MQQFRLVIKQDAIYRGIPGGSQNKIKSFKEKF